MTILLAGCNLGATDGGENSTDATSIVANTDVPLEQITPFSVTRRVQATSIFGATASPAPLNYTGQLVYARDENATGWDIFTMFANGTGITNLTNRAGDDQRPKWSPDGTRIAFDSDTAGNREIFIMNVDGSGLRNITNNTATDLRANWGIYGIGVIIAQVLHHHFCKPFPCQ